MCDDITCDELHLPSFNGMVVITCDGQTSDDKNQECDIVGLGLLI